MKNSIRILSLLIGLVFLFSATGCNLFITEEVTTTSISWPSTSATTTTTTTGTGETTGTGGADTPTGNGTTTATTTKTTAGVRTEPKLSGKLELQIFTNESQTADGGWTTVINEFEDATGVSVTAHIGSSVNTMMSGRWKKDNPPDMVWIDGSGISDLVYETSGKFYDITSLYEDGYVYGTNTRIRDVIDPNMMTRNNGKIMRMPLLSTAGGVWYDAKFFKENNFTVPNNYTELLTMAQQAKAAGYASYTYPGMYASYCLSNFIMPAVAAYGQEYTDQFLSGSKAAVGDTRFKKILQNYTDFCRTDGYLMPSTTTADHTTVQQRWITHKCLLIANGLWLPDETRKLWAKQNFDMTWHPSPMIEEGQKQTVLITAKKVAVASKAKNLDNALAFVRFILREDSQNTLMYSFGYMGVRTDMQFDVQKFVQEAGGSDASLSTASALSYINSNKVDRVYWNESWGQLGDIIAAELNNLAMKGGSATVDSALSKILSECGKP